MAECPNGYDYIWLDGKLEPVDKGLGFLILQLNQAGIKTLGSCNGHGNNGYPHVLCAPGTEEKLKEFGCKIINTRPDGKVKAYFPVRCFGGKIR
jgi:hypothetical protein